MTRLRHLTGLIFLGAIVPAVGLVFIAGMFVAVSR